MDELSAEVDGAVVVDVDDVADVAGEVVLDDVGRSLGSRISILRLGA